MKYTAHHGEKMNVSDYTNYKHDCIVTCQCGNEIIRITQDAEFEEDIYLSMFQYYNSASMSFRQRIKYLWQILRHGMPYSDCICLKQKDLKALREAINKILDDGS